MERVLSTSARNAALPRTLAALPSYAAPFSGSFSAWCALSSTPFTPAGASVNVPAVMHSMRSGPQHEPDQVGGHSDSRERELTMHRHGVGVILGHDAAHNHTRTSLPAFTCCNAAWPMRCRHGFAARLCSALVEPVALGLAQFLLYVIRVRRVHQQACDGGDEEADHAGKQHVRCIDPVEQCVAEI